MLVNVQVDSSTLSHQFVALSNLFRELSGVPEAVRVQPAVETVTVVPDTAGSTVAEAEQTTPATKRRRTKAEIAADEAAAKVAAAEAEAKLQEEAISGEGSVVAQAEAAAQASNEAAAQASNEATVTVADDFEKAVVTGKTYTESEAQQLATVIARSKGPQVVKDKIAELGAGRIGDLTAEQLNELGTYLESLK